MQQQYIILIFGSLESTFHPLIQLIHIYFHRYVDRCIVNIKECTDKVEMNYIEEAWNAQEQMRPKMHSNKPDFGLGPAVLRVTKEGMVGESHLQEGGSHRTLEEASVTLPPSHFP